MDQRHVLVFNGEILNYSHLRQVTPYPYRTAGDTEVVLASHAVHQEDAPARFEGQFAYAVYDTLTRSLTLARDRLGILPLFWYQDEVQLVFASDISALLAGLGFIPELDPSSLDAYLAGRSVPAPFTLLRGIRKLVPGRTMRIDSSGMRKEQVYWRPDVRRNRRLGYSEAVDTLDTLMSDAVRSALVADVPVGSYLSGGVDSSLVVAKVSDESGHSGVHTFCAEFGDERTDESSYASVVADLFGTQHHTVRVRPEDFIQLWPWLSLRRGAPLSEPADIAVFRLAEAASEHVKVVLSGEGSDELFGGYPKYRYARLTSAVGIVPAAIREPALVSLERRLPVRGRRLGVALRALSEPTFDERVRGWFAPFTTAERQKLLGVPPIELPKTLPHQPPVRRMLLDDLRSWLPDNLLERGDRMTMAASVELRPPFLNRAVVDFALSLPPSLLVYQGTGKRLVKEVARRHLPKEIVDRPKVGFRVPLDGWFRNGLRDYAWDLVSATNSVTNVQFDSSQVRALFSAHDKGKRDESIRIWTLASLEVWHSSLHAKPSVPAAVG
ncbi:Asparagine synthase (Glutamine-hydrolyzing) [Nostocoides japonicum T1-X7]|uniref:asparagine synthase (glutamine-hydrolyzing) n=2 Tax=Nostocoides japonicum TaxID=99481 RepID=A0A077M522_9MICO|nr:Asparagine synthase (Glutamine-hydrolyzing) [Tetrasphaera japonica T1-X7]